MQSRRYQYDVDEFRRALAKAGKAKGVRSEAYLHQAISLYRGDYLEDLYSDWTVEIRASLRGEYCHVLEELAGYCGHEGRLREAVEFYRKLLDKEPLREDIHRQVMRCLAQMGERAGAMKQFKELQEILGEELGAEPSRETTELYEELLAEDV